jgi:spermidine/putrescine transport system ATP-binding protein
MTPTPDLECRALTKAFTDFVAVRGVDFTVPAGSFFSILGPSGCGKTTLLRMIAGFAEPTSGDILIRGRSVLQTPPNRRPVNMVFQHLALFPMMSVGENVAFGLRRRKVDGADIARRVDAVLERVGLAGMAGRRIDQLSGGQKQRVAIARCMVLEPDVLLLDEPLGALDLKLREHMKIELKKLQGEFNTTFIYITHDQSEALVMSDRVAVMNKGVFEQVGTPRELYFEPRTAFVAGFVGETNRWRGTVELADETGVKLRTASGLALLASAPDAVPATGTSMEVFVRPEAITLSRDAAGLVGLDTSLSGTVGSILFNGANSRLLVRVADAGEIDVALPQTSGFSGLAVGDTVRLGWSLDQARCYPVTP